MRSPVFTTSLALAAASALLGCSSSPRPGPSLDGGTITDGTVTVDVLVDAPPADALADHPVSTDPCDASTCPDAAVGSEP